MSWGVPRGTRPSPNIRDHPDRYELLNRAADHDGAVAAAVAAALPRGGVVVDVGCGTGFHLPRLAERADRVLGVEPEPHLVTLARRRTRELGNVRVEQGVAQRLPLAPASVDAVHAHWAYFFGPGCEPGLAEARRVLRRGGVVVVVDVDLAGAGYPRWLRAGWRPVDPGGVERFWAAQGFVTRRVPSRWVFPDRAALEAVLAIEFPPDVAARAASETPGLELAVPQVVRVHRSPT